MGTGAATRARPTGDRRDHDDLPGRLLRRQPVLQLDHRTLSKALISLAPDDLEFTEIPIGNLPLYSPDFDPERGKTALALSGEMPSAADPPSGCRFRTRCPLAQERCAVEEPVLRPLGSPAHRVACHFPLLAPA